MRQSPYQRIKNNDFLVAVTAAHERFECWTEHAVGTGHLYVATHPVDATGKHGAYLRLTIEIGLIDLLHPPCN